MKNWIYCAGSIGCYDISKSEERLLGAIGAPNDRVFFLSKAQDSDIVYGMGNVVRDIREPLNLLIENAKTFSFPVSISSDGVGLDMMRIHNFEDSNFFEISEDDACFLEEEGAECIVEYIAGDWGDYKKYIESLLESLVALSRKNELCNLPDGKIRLYLCDDEAIAEANMQYRDKKGATNVISLSFDGADGYLGEILISCDTIYKEAGEIGVSFNEHCAHMIIHGFLHLKGLDHLEDSETVVMEDFESSLMSDLGFEDPHKR